MRTTLLLLCLAALVRAEPAFQNLTSNFDGSGVWFSSPLRMKGTEQYAHPKIFQWDEKNGVRLYDQKPPTVQVVLGRSSTTGYQLLSLSSSADGGTMAVTGEFDCVIGPSCIFSYELYRSEIRRGAGSFEVGGSVSLSPNGRFAYRTSSISPLFSAYNDHLRDVTSGEDISINGLAGVFPYRHRVANDGTVVVTESRGPPAPLYLRSWTSGELRQLPGLPAPVMINDAATRLFSSNFGLVAYDIAAARMTSLNSTASAFDISNDGSVVAYVDAGQAWIVLADGSGKRRITDGPETIVDLTLSGDGNFLFAVTDASRIVRIDLRGGTAREIVPKASLLRTGPSAGGSAVATPGNLYEFIAQALPEIAEVRMLGGAQKVLTQTGGDLLIQTSYDLAEGTGWVELVTREQTEGPFVSSVIWPPVQITLYRPAWYLLPDRRHIAALHEDFSAVVTPANPARPSEIVHVFGTGFGPVAPQPEFGAAAGVNPLSRVVAPMVCEMAGLIPEPAELLYAGLAPGYIGLYQFDVRLPALWENGDASLTCRRAADSPLGDRAGGLLAVVSQAK